jgi:hypothetical protein
MFEVYSHGRILIQKTGIYLLEPDLHGAAHFEFNWIPLT